MPVRSCLFLSLLVLFSSWSCGPTEERARQYELSGQVLAVRPDTDEVLIKHGDIKNFMPGMTMPFKVRDRALLHGRRPGDLVTAQLMVEANAAWLTTLEKTGYAPLAEAASIPAASFITPLAVGDEVPSTTLTDHEGKALALTDWRGSVVVVTFVYTRCPLPQFCPLLDRRFTEIQRGAQADERLRSRTRLLSVSFDPKSDTPAVLRAHMDKLGADPSVWRYATAPADVVDRFAATFGVNVIREEDGTITHNLRTAVVDENGRIVRLFGSEAWTADEVLATLRGAVATR
jgi:protein SCO1